MPRSGKAIGLLMMAAGAASVGAQTPRPYTSATDLVSVYASVTGRDGRTVTDLTRDDFEILDNGRRQPIAVFSNEPQPIAVVIMLDCSGSQGENLERLREGATAFVRRLLPADRARLGNFGFDIRLSPAAFTADPRTLLELIAHDLQDFGPSPVWTAVDWSLEALAAERGRRVVLLLTDGHDDPGVGQVAVAFDAVRARARRLDIMVYTIGLPGVLSRSTQAILAGGVSAISSASKPTKPHRNLRTLAADTGGSYVELRSHDAMAETFARIADDLHQQYWIGFTPATLDGRTHRVEVNVRRRDVTVRARPTYMAEAR